jgi:HD-like signal output (HDOD) protein
MPAVVPQLLQTLRNPQHTSSALSRLVAQDPVLVAAVLRVANSPYYRSGREIESIEQAVLVLGDDGLRQLVASVAFRPLINVQSGHFTRRGAERVWDQSEKTAVACRMLAPAAGASSFEAHLASLLQNIGTIVAMRLLDERYDGAGASGSTRFCATFLAAARQLACAIGQRWAFPESVTTAVAQQERIAAASSPLAALLRACDQVSKLRLLVDAGRVAGDDPRLGIGDQSLIAGCLAELGTRSAAAPA